MSKTHQETGQSRASKFMKDIGIYAIGNLGSKVITFLMVPLYTYFVEQPADYGYYDVCLTAIFLLMPFVTLQLRDGAFRFLLDTDDNDERTKIVTMAFRTLFSSTVITVVITIGIAIFFDVKYLWYTLALLITMSLQDVISQVFRGLGNNKAFVAVGILSAFGIGLFSIVFVVFFHMEVEGIFLANIVARLVALAVVEYKVKTVRQFLNVKVKTREVARHILKYSLPLLPGSVCWWLTGSSDRWFIQEFLGLETNGIYAVALRFASIVQTFAIIFYQAWQETAILQYNSKDRDTFFSKMFNSYIYILTVILVGFCFLMKMNYGWLVNDSYQGSVWYIYPMTLSSVLFAISAFFDMGYQCAKDTKRTLPAIVLAAVVNVALNFALIRPLGIRGILTTSITTYLVLVIYRWHDMKRYFNLSIYRISILSAAVILLSAAAFYLSHAVWQDFIAMALLLGVLFKFCPQMVRDDIVSKISGKFHFRHHTPGDEVTNENRKSDTQQ